MVTRKHIKKLVALLSSVIMAANAIYVCPVSAVDDSKEDNSWTDNKDEFRHYGKQENGSSGRTLLGQAEGEYAVELHDGSWYWYHQSERCLTCVNCGNWSKMYWGSRAEHSHRFAHDGCAMYSMSIIISNLYGEAIDPIKWLTSAGCEMIENGNACVSNNSTILNGRCIRGAYPSLEVAKEVYGLDSWHIDTSSKAAFEKGLNECLDQGGMVWYCYSHSNGRGMHFIPLRSREGGNYYHLNESQPHNFDKPLTLDWIWGNMRGGFAYALVNPDPERKSNPAGENNDGDAPGNDSQTPGNNAPIGVNGKWYPNIELKKSEDKIALGAGVYAYKGIPWDATEKTYVADTDEMAYDLVSFVSSTSDGTPTNGDGKEVTGEMLMNTNCRCTNAFKPDILKTNWKESGGGRIKDIDGVTVVGVEVPPAVVDKTYNGMFTTKGSGSEWLKSNNASSSKYNFENKKMCAILMHKDTQEMIYLPCTTVGSIDATFPGGMTYTYCQIDSGSKVEDDKIKEYGTLSSMRTRATKGNTYQKTEAKDLCKLLNTKDFGSPKQTSWDLMWQVCSFYNFPKEAYKNIKNNYRVAAFVVWE